MNFISSLMAQQTLLMEGALGTRLREEYQLAFDEKVAMAIMIYSEQGRAALRELWTGYMQIAQDFELPFLATTPTRRANWERIGSQHPSTILEDNVHFLQSIQQNSLTPMYIGGMMGCRGDAYTGADAMETATARQFHYWQAERLAATGINFLYAAIMPTLPESIGMAQAMSDTGLPYIISFTLLKTGKLPDGTSLHDGIKAIDRSTVNKPACYMSNCIHPDNLYAALIQPFNRTPLVRERFCGIQANASPLPPNVLDQSKGRQQSTPESLANSLRPLLREINLKIIGGCCGTDEQYLAAMAAAAKNSMKADKHPAGQ